MYSVFEHLLQSKGITAAQFSKDTRISQSTISTWKSSGTIGNKYLATIAEYFGCSIDLIVTGKEKEPTNYYINEDAREMAQFMFENPEYKVLFDASRKISNEDIETVKAIMDKFKMPDAD